MKLGLIADIHADIHALENALDLLDSHGAAEILCAGDLVDFGAHANQVLNTMRELAIPCVRGNHDRKLLKRNPKRLKTHHTDPRSLSAVNLAYLEALPTGLRRRYGAYQIAIYHAAPDDDMARIHPDLCSKAEMLAQVQAGQADIYLTGHIHLPVYAQTEAGVIINPGSVYTVSKAPRQSSQTCALLDLDGDSFDYQLYDINTGAPHTVHTWPWWQD